MPAPTVLDTATYSMFQTVNHKMRGFVATFHLGFVNNISTFTWRTLTLIRRTILRQRQWYHCISLRQPVFIVTRNSFPVTLHARACVNSCHRILIRRLDLLSSGVIKHTNRLTGRFRPVQPGIRTEPTVNGKSLKSSIIQRSHAWLFRPTFNDSDVNVVALFEDLLTNDVHP